MDVLGVVVVNDLRLLCGKCGHNKRLHGNGPCRSIGCKNCDGFTFFSSEMTVHLSLGKDPSLGNKNISPYQVALHLAEEDTDLAKVFFAEVIWNPGIYYGVYNDLGGSLSKDGWVMLCQTNRKG